MERLLTASDFRITCYRAETSLRRPDVTLPALSVAEVSGSEGSSSGRGQKDGAIDWDRIGRNWCAVYQDMPVKDPSLTLLMTHHVTLPALSEAEVSGSEGTSSGMRQRDREYLPDRAGWTGCARGCL